MAEVTSDQVSQRARELFNKGFAAFERGSFEYAIEMLEACLESEPRFRQARQFLRAAEIRKARREKVSALAQGFELVTALPTYLKGLLALRRGQAEEAVKLAEGLLRRDPLHLRFVRLFVRAATAADMGGEAIDTLKLVLDRYPRDAWILNTLGVLYLAAGQPREARACFDALVAFYPHDPGAIKMLKDAMAQESLSSDGWATVGGRKGGYRELIRDEEEAKLLEQKAKAVKTDQEADNLIREAEAKIQAEPGNLNYYRHLARLYGQRRRFAEAIATLTRALEINPGDPELDNLRSLTRLQQMEHEIEQLQAAGDENGARRKREERERYVEEDLQERVKRYPNDLRLRYELGLVMYERGRINEAIQQFQLSQRSHQHRIRSLYYLALCFKQKAQYDLALQQLETAVSELTLMDDTKKDICYEIGLLAEKLGDHTKALEYFKRIYQADIGYKDVAERVEKAYRRT